MEITRFDRRTVFELAAALGGGAFLGWAGNRLRRPSSEVEVYAKTGYVEAVTPTEQVQISTGEGWVINSAETDWYSIDWETVEIGGGEDWWMGMEIARPIDDWLEDSVETEVGGIELSDGKLTKADIIRSGFDPVQAERLALALPALREAEQQAGLDWRVFASLLWMEHAGAMTNANADGPYQITRPWYRKFLPVELVRRGIMCQQGRDYYFNAKRPNSREDFVAISVYAAKVIQAHVRAAARVRGTKVDVNNGRLEDQAWFAAVYNGMPQARWVKGMQVYGDPWHHPYVMNRFQGMVNGQNYANGRMYASDGRGGYVLLRKDGYLAYYQRCTRLKQLRGV